MGGQAKACPTTEEVSPLGGACFSLPIHTGAHHKFHDIRSSQSRRGTQECVRHGLVREVIFALVLTLRILVKTVLAGFCYLIGNWPVWTACAGAPPLLSHPPPCQTNPLGPIPLLESQKSRASISFPLNACPYRAPARHPLRC